MLTGHVAEAADATLPGSVRLLPGFDPYVIGSTGHAELLMPGPYRGRVHRPQGWVSPVLLVDGRIDGVWRYQQKGKRLLVTIEPFVEQPTWAQRGAEEEAERLAAFLGGVVEVRWA
jgi:hypothetical protein